MTFIALDQPRVFLLSVAFGIYFGFCYFPFCVLKCFCKGKTAKAIITSLYFTLGAIPFSWYSCALNFGNFALYQILGVFLGLLLYKVSFHKPVAIFSLRVYNVINNSIKRLIKALKGKNELRKNERRKKKTRVVGNSVGADNVFHGVGFYSSVSIHRNIR